MQYGYKTALCLVSLLAMITAGCAQHSARTGQPEAPPATAPATQSTPGTSESATAAPPAEGTATAAPTTAAAAPADAGTAPSATAAETAPTTPAAGTAAPATAGNTVAPAADNTAPAAAAATAPATADTTAPATANVSVPAGDAAGSTATQPDTAAVEAEKQKKELAAKLLAMPPQDISNTISLMAKHPRVRWQSRSGQYAYYVGGEFNAEYNPTKKVFTISSDPSQVNAVSCEYNASGELMNGKSQDMKAECNEMVSKLSSYLSR